MNSLTEKYRPASWDSVVGHDVVVRQCQTVIGRGWGGRAWWISGPSGTGKTTIAKLISAEGADPFNTIEYDASDITPASLKELERDICMFGMGSKRGRAIIINEAHGLRRSDVIRQMLVLLERLPDHSTIIFTTTTMGEQLLMADMADAGPLMSRCTVIRLCTTGLEEAFAKEVRRIARVEGLDGRPIGDYRALYRKHEGNMRAMLQEAETGCLQVEAVAKPVKKGPSAGRPVCRHCGEPVPKGKKFCGTSCYFKNLSKNKRKR